MAGVGFGQYKRCCIITKNSQYYVCFIIESFNSHLADTICSFGFAQTHFYNDVWISHDDYGKHYEYICTHVNDFMIFPSNPEKFMKDI